MSPVNSTYCLFKVKPADLWIYCYPTLYSRGSKIVGAIESIRDITAIKKTKNDLKELNLTLEQHCLTEPVNSKM